ncbi:TPA: staphylokinase domain-containing protein [Streptococcus agalactiae]|nr:MULTISPECIES: staphylokinase domain-containing protein [Streptococcus]AIK71675.1 kinase [Streptococcus agalactiae]AIK73796.1 kinase [Streptococcus agalactiae]AIK75844.1 kinase [Streptococcus agalactiae]EPT90372.1 streptokinase [Streptococcus agalactiae BSU442]EPU82214.1 streptokinase [Streptococcus agalactiae GB00174]
MSLYYTEKAHAIAGPSDRQYVEKPNPHIIVNVTGTDQNGNSILPHYIEVNVKMGQTLSKEEILDYIARNLNSSVGGESKNVQYSNIEFKESAYLKRQLDDRKIEEIAIDNDGVTVPKDGPNKFWIDVPVTCTVNSITPKLHKVEWGTPISVLHYVQFVDKTTGKTLEDFKTIDFAEIDLGIRHTGDSITDKELYNSAYSAFLRSKLTKQGYQFQYRISTDVQQNLQVTKKLYNYDVNEELINYQIENNRPTLNLSNEAETDIFFERYYVSRDGDSLARTESTISIKMVDSKTEQALFNHTLTGYQLATVSNVYNRLFEENLIPTTKSGEKYFIQNMKKTAEQEYTVYLSETPYSKENAPVISYDARPVDWDYHSGASGSLENQPNIYTEEDSTEFLGNKPQAACYPNKQFACENTDSTYNYSYLEK